MHTASITPNPWPEGPPVYETDPSLVPAGQRPEADERTINGIVLPFDEAIRLSQIYAARNPMWSLYFSDKHPHRNLLIARLYLTNPEEPTKTAYILMAQYPDQIDQLHQFLSGNFKQIPSKYEDILLFINKSAGTVIDQ